MTEARIRDILFVLLAFRSADASSSDWSGFCVTMARERVKSTEAGGEISGRTKGNAVRTLRSDEIDIAFSPRATPSRAFLVEFPRPIMWGLSMVHR